jgi:hypothetical protein
MCQPQPQPEHALTPQAGRLFAHLFPGDLPTGTQQCSHIADPGEPLPMMFGAMHTQNQQQVLRGHSVYRGVQDFDDLWAFPQAGRVKGKVKRQGGNSPVEFDEHSSVRTNKFIHFTPTRKPGAGSILPPLISLRLEQSAGPPCVLRTYQNIEITKLP